MAKRKSTWSFGTIIFWGFLAYMWFGGGDDNDKAEVTIIENDKPSIEQTIKDVGNQLKESAVVIIEEATDKFEEVQASKEKEVKPEPEPEPEPDEEKSEEMIAQPEPKEKPQVLESLNENKPVDIGMKKL